MATKSQVEVESEPKQGPPPDTTKPGGGVRQLLHNYRFQLKDGFWVHSDLRDVKVEDKTLGPDSLPRVRALIRLVQDSGTMDTKKNPPTKPIVQGTGGRGKLLTG